MNIYFLCFSAHVNISASKCNVAAAGEVLGAEALMDDPGDGGMRSTAKMHSKDLSAILREMATLILHMA